MIEEIPDSFRERLINWGFCMRQRRRQNTSSLWLIVRAGEQKESTAPARSPYSEKFADDAAVIDKAWVALDDDQHKTALKMRYLELKGARDIADKLGVFSWRARNILRTAERVMYHTLCGDVVFSENIAYTSDKTSSECVSEVAETQPFCTRKKRTTRRKPAES